MPHDYHFINIIKNVEWSSQAEKGSRWYLRAAHGFSLYAREGEIRTSNPHVGLTRVGARGPCDKDKGHLDNGTG